MGVEPIRFGAPVKDESKMFSALHDIYSEAFSNMGHNFKLIPCVPYSCGNLVKNGNLDGEVARHSHYSELYPQLDRIDFILFKLTSVAITKNGTTKVKSLDDFKQMKYKIGYQIGYRGYEQKLNSMLERKNLISVNHWREGIQKVKQGEIDVYLGVKQIILADTKQADFTGLTIHEIKDYTIDIYPYISEKLMGRKEELHLTLIKMRKARRIEAIFTKHGIPLDMLPQ